VSESGKIKARVVDSAEVIQYPIRIFQVRWIAELQGRSSVVEQRPFKPKVVGSIPTAPTIHPSGR
jgi:hypothetical protein